MGERAALGLIALALFGCSCGDDVDVPSDPELVETVHEGPRDPRVPPDFDLALPEGAVVRYGESNAERATVLVTVDAPPAEALSAARAMLEARGWTVRVRTSERARPPQRWREVLGARHGDGPVASVVVERGAAELTRVHLSQQLEGGETFHSPSEPREWRRVTRGPIPALADDSEPACIEAMRGLCDSYSAAGGPDAIDCAMDHRNACILFLDPDFVARTVPDAVARLRDALRAHDSVGSRGARAETLAQLHVELLLARANLSRARVIGADAVELGELISATRAEGVTVDTDTSTWFVRPPNPEIVTGGPP